MTIVAIVKCKNGYIALVEEYEDLNANAWDPDTAHVFTEFSELVDWLLTLFEGPTCQNAPSVMEK